MVPAAVLGADAPDSAEPAPAAPPPLRLTSPESRPPHVPTLADEVLGALRRQGAAHAGVTPTVNAALAKGLRALAGAVVVPPGTDLAKLAAAIVGAYYARPGYWRGQGCPAAGLAQAGEWDACLAAALAPPRDSRTPEQIRSDGDAPGGRWDFATGKLIPFAPPPEEAL